MVKDFVLKPSATWEMVLKHEESTQSLIKERLSYYAAIPVLATFLGTLIFGMRIPIADSGGLTVVHRVAFGALLVRAVFQYGLTIGGIWLTGRIISYLAPRFGGIRDDGKGFKVAFYCSLPSLLASAIYLIPPLAILAFLAGIFGLYLMYIGLPLFMQVPKEKSLLYFITVIAVTIVIYAILSTVLANVHGSGSAEVTSFFERT